MSIPAGRYFAVGFDDAGEGTDSLLELLIRGAPAWHRDALCREYPTVNFFPARGEDCRPAKVVCRECRVFVECRQWSLRQDERLVGIWGGLSQRERRKLREDVTHF